MLVCQVLYVICFFFNALYRCNSDIGLKIENGSLWYLIIKFIASFDYQDDLCRMVSFTVSNTSLITLYLGRGTDIGDALDDTGYGYWVYIRTNVC